MTVRTWLTVVVLLLDDAAALVAVILALRFFGIDLPLSLKIFIALLFGGFLFLIHKAIIPSLRRKKVTGSEGMIGLIGRAVEPLAPNGVVRIGGEYWSAKSVDGDISAGEDVEVMGLDGLVLKVRAKVQ